MMDDPVVTPPKPLRQKWNSPLILAFLLTVGFFATLWYVLIFPVQQGSERVLDIMLGSLTTVWIGSMHYFYNSTAGSQKKTDLLARALPSETEGKP